MNNFINWTLTKVFFGADMEKETGAHIKEFGGSRVLIVYGGGSAKRSGLIDVISQSLDEAGLTFEEFGGAKPNPTLAHAREGVKKALALQADFILAVGGGSAIDTAKAIAIGIANPETDIWDFWCGKTPLTKTSKTAAVLTIPAAGSEMSDSAVLTDEETDQKRGINTDLNRCVFAVMNPSLAMTLPKKQLANGITDIMMHTLERYFTPGSDCDLTDEIAEGLLRTMITNGRAIMKDSSDYHAMAEIMWSSSLSHNGLTGLGRNKDFSVHALGQAIGGKYDFTHGETLSAVWGAWARYVLPLGDVLPRFVRYARKVWNVETPDEKAAALEGIDKTVAYFKELGMPVTLSDLGIEPDDAECLELALDATRGDKRTLTVVKPLTSAEVADIYRNARA
jgi:alcohol dehydrogenase YqhD (iron-dependent ADH family)